MKQFALACLVWGSFANAVEIAGDYHLMSEPRYRISIHENLLMSTNVTVAHPKTGAATPLSFARPLKLNAPGTIYSSLGLYRMAFQHAGQTVWCNFPALFEAAPGADGNTLTTVFSIPKVSGLSSFGTCYHQGEIRYKFPFRRD